MKIGFFGTPELAAQCLIGLHSMHDISFVVTAVDKESGRNRKLQFCPVKAEAMRLNIPVLQPASMKDRLFFESMQKYNADIFVVVAYGNLIPKHIYDYPPLKTINLHPSLLPKYRGAAPVQWALINGETETGITVQVINERLDAGDIIEQDTIKLDKDDTAADVWRIVHERGTDLLNKAIAGLASGNSRRIVQDESQATYCGKIDRATSVIDWNRPATDIHNLVRALNPKPVAFTTFRGAPIKIWKTVLVDEYLSAGLEPGAVLPHQKKRLMAGTGSGPLEIISVQPANKKIMDGLSFINGYRLSQSDRFV